MRSKKALAFNRMIAVLWVAMLAGSRSVQAGLVTYTFSGKVDSITDTSTDHYVPTDIQDGSTFVGTFSFDNTAPGTIDGADAFYRGIALDLSETVTINGKYTYTLITPTSQDEIDILGDTFEFFKRGPTVYTTFAPNPPFSFFEFIGQTQTNILSNAVISSKNATAGVSDQQTSGRRTTSSVPTSHRCNSRCRSRLRWCWLGLPRGLYWPTARRG